MTFERLIHLLSSKSKVPPKLPLGGCEIRLQAVFRIVWMDWCPAACQVERGTGQESFCCDCPVVFISRQGVKTRELYLTPSAQNFKTVRQLTEDGMAANSAPGTTPQTTSFRNSPQIPQTKAPNMDKPALRCALSTSFLLRHENAAMKAVLPVNNNVDKILITKCSQVFKLFTLLHSPFLIVPYLSLIPYFVFA